MHKYFIGRYNPLENETDARMECLWSRLASTFYESWLLSPGDHPLQSLWQRHDAQSTIELYTLACAIEIFQDLDPQWVKYQIEEIKSTNANNRRGALFELIGLACFHRKPQTVTPAARSQKGYDGIVQVSGGGKLRLSLKSYGISRHNEVVTKKAQQIETAIVAEMRIRGNYALEILIDIPSRYPSEIDWSILNNGLRSVFDLYRGVPGIWGLKNTWVIALRPLPEERTVFYQKSTSYTLIMLTPYHKNERINLFSKFNEACLNLKACCANETQDMRNIIFIRLPWNAPIKTCVAWADEYFQMYPTAPVSGICFFQPSVSQKQDGKSVIHVCLALAARSAYMEWYSRQPSKLNIALPVGIVSNTPSALIFQIGKQVIGIEDRFVFQRGHHYEVSYRDKEGCIKGTLRNPAPGVVTHAVMEPIPGKGKIVMSGKFPPDDHLFLI